MAGIEGLKHFPVDRLTKSLKFYSSHDFEETGYGSNRSYPVFLALGLISSVISLFYNEFFASYRPNPLAESTTILMFALSLFFLIRRKRELSFNMVFGIPLITYFFFQSDFSVDSADEYTIYYVVAWYLAGMFVLAAWTPFGFRNILFFIAGWISLVYHCTEAGIISNFLSAVSFSLSNPFLILTILFILLSLLRISYDKTFRIIQNRFRQLEENNLDLFLRKRDPMAKIRAERDDDGNVLRFVIERVNPAFETAFTTSFAEAKNQELHFYFDLIFRNHADWNHLLLKDTPVPIEIQVPFSGKWYTASADWHNSSTCFCVFKDITEVKEEVSELMETRSRYLALLEAIPDLFFILDKDGIFMDVVFKGQESFLPETTELIGASVYKAGFSEMMAAKLIQCIRESILKDSIETIEYTLDARRGALLYEMRIARLDEQSVICISRDITQRKKSEFELEAARKKAEDADALKSKFLANLSHDIRTPVNVIVGLSKLLAEPTLSDYVKSEIIHDIQQQGDILLQIIENTIHLSKIETNTLQVTTTYTNIHRLLRELYLHFYPLLPDHRELQLILHTEIEHGEVGFETDPMLLRDSLYKLIDNAIRFTPAGSVTFGYIPATGNSVEFFVSDTGPGIPEAERENIFHRFYVIETDRQSMKSGPGLGLPIAQHFVALLGGELKVDSPAGKGSRFWFRLPLRNQKGFLRVV